MNVTVNLDRAHLAARMKNGANAAGKATAEQILNDCNQYSVPDDEEHTLKDSKKVEQIDKDYAATWNAPYAAYQFYGCWPDGSHVIQKHTQGYSQNPSIQWTEAARAVYGDDWRTVAQNEFVKGAGG